jgi:hypothetical protein
MKKLVLTIAFVVGITTSLFAQNFDLSAEIRPRFENKHGYKSLLATNADGANFISQRSRLNFNFKNENLTFKLVMQNVRVWGDVSTLAADDNATALHEAWAEAKLNDKLSLKLGRQEIVYDDHRIFGSVGWAQQARSHDAFIFKYKPNANNRLDVGFAINQDSQAGVDNLYSNAAGYKNFQYAWYHGKFNNVGLSFLLLNTGIEYLNSSLEQTVDNMQTIGPRISYKKDKLDANAALYFQTGKVANTAVKALYYTANLGYKVNNTFKLGLGLEYLSGKDMNDSSADINTFAPLFGTNHKFNGWMDYFYVGYGNPTGLTDINATFAYKKDKLSMKLIPHIFSATNNVYNGTTLMNASLGTEIDFTIGYKIAKDIKFSAGYSKMFGSDTMEVLKGGDKDENSSWAWLMFTFKPKLFTSKTTK